MSGSISAPMRPVEPCRWGQVITLCVLSVMGGAVSAADAPSLDVLEFLGDWQDGDGHDLDPTMLDDAGDATTVAAPSGTRTQDDE